MGGQYGLCFDNKKKLIRKLYNKYIHTISNWETCLNFDGFLEDSYLVSLGEVKRIKVHANFCSDCEVIVYYNLYAEGCIPVHNKVIV